MPVRKLSDATLVSKTTLTSLMTDVTPTENKKFQFGGAEVYKVTYDLPGVAGIENTSGVGFVPGHIYSQAEIDRAYPVATIASITPATGLAAGGTAVTIKGTNLEGVTAVTFGGTAATSVTVVDSNTVTCVTPAKTAGTYSVVLTDDSGSVTVANAYVYT